MHADVFVGLSEPLGRHQAFGRQYGARFGYRTNRLGVDISLDRCHEMGGSDAPKRQRSRLMAGVLRPLRVGASTQLSFRAATGLKLAERRSNHFITGGNYYYWHVGPAVEAGLLLEVGGGWARFLVETAAHVVSDKFGNQEAYRTTVSADLRVGMRVAF